MAKEAPKRKGPVALVILDGWGISSDTPNVVSEASIPHFEALLRKYPNSSLQASGEAVGLMAGQMGDSNVGHLNLGAGRIVYQDVVRISRSISQGQLFQNPALNRAMSNGAQNSLHLMGLVSDGGVHSLDSHLYALLEMAKLNGVRQVYVHAFLDGRDVPPTSAGKYLERLEEKMQHIGVGRISSVTGRFYAMDRDKRWDRLEKAYTMLTQGSGALATDWRRALGKSYESGVTDEFVLPTKLSSGDFRPIQKGDSVVFFNYRADRAREITHAFVDDDYDWFNRGPKLGVHFCAMMRYEEGILGEYAFEPLVLENTLGEVVAKHGLSQLRIAETEKYAHVTFFFNGKKDLPFPGEKRILVPSPKDVATYDMKPEMSAAQVTDVAIAELRNNDYDFVVLNYANPDMVGHTGVFSAAVKALEVVDVCLARFLNEVLRLDGVALVLADHGNVEDLKPGQKGAHTYHSHNPVPCILVGGGGHLGLENGLLADVAPTILELLEIPKPKEMDRSSLITKVIEGGKNG